MRPVTESLRVGKVIGLKDGWAARRALVEPLRVDSMCEVQRRQQLDGTSLGVFKPSEVQDLVIEADSALWDAKHEAVIAQPSLFAPDKKRLVKIPYRFKYRYRCGGSCSGHEQTVVDWEIGEAFLGWNRFDVEDRLQRIRERWLNELCGPDKDTRFFVGNQHQHPGSFLVLGVFWPPATTEEAPELPVSPEQLRLGLDVGPIAPQ